MSLAKPITITDDRIGVFICPEVAANINGISLFAPGDSLTCTASYTITQPDLDAGFVTNVAAATDANRAATSLPVTATVTAIPQPALTLAKAATPTTYSTVGQVITYTYVATNSGNVSLAKPITVTDDKLGNFACPQFAPTRLDTLAPGEFVTCTATHTVTQNDLNRGDLTNVATATNGATASLPVTVTVSAVQQPALVIAKHATPTTYTTVGQVISYTYVVTNSGNVSLRQPITVTDNRIGAFVCPEVTVSINGISLLAPGASLTCAATYTITQTHLDAGAVTNVAWATD